MVIGPLAERRSGSGDLKRDGKLENIWFHTSQSYSKKRKLQKCQFSEKKLIEQAVISILTFLHWIPTVGWPAERDVIVSSQPRLIHEKVFKRHLIWYSKNGVFVEKPPQILMKSIKRGQ